MKRCFDLNGVTRFYGKGEAYARARPSYPQEAIRFILGDTDRSIERIADVGAGTAIATNLLAEHGGAVIGVDPNLEMLRSSNLRPGIHLVAGRAEHLPFEDGTISLLTAFNSFHWFQPAPFFAEAHRVLTPDGKLALVWNDWDFVDEFTVRFVELMRSCTTAHPPEDRQAEVAPLYETRLFGEVRRASFRNDHELERESLHLRLQSVSYVPQSGPDWERLSGELDTLFEKYADGNGLVKHRYFTVVFVADRT